MKAKIYWTISFWYIRRLRILEGRSSEWL
jgi:hypothetical protein